MVRCVFTDFDEFADAISGLNGRYIPTSRSQQEWWIDPIHIGRLRLQQLQVGAPAAFAGDGEHGELTIGIPTTQRDAIRINGRALTDDSFILIRPDRPLTYSAPGVTRWAGVTVPTEFATHRQFRDAAEWSDAMLSDTSVRTNPALLRRVSLLVALLCSGNDSINISDPAAVAAAEEDILIAATHLLRASTCTKPQRLGRRPANRDQIIGRCLEFFRENQGRPILVGDLCNAVDATERTLRNTFKEYFGVGPIRFLRSRQLQEVRSALLTSRFPNETVGQVAAHFGVWDFSQFSRNYRAIYGESPSGTLSSRRPVTDSQPMDPSLESMRSWMQYASLRFAQSEV